MWACPLQVPREPVRTSRATLPECTRTEQPQHVGQSPCAFSDQETGRAGETRLQIESRCGLGVLQDWPSPRELGEIVAVQAFLSCP